MKLIAILLLLSDYLAVIAETVVSTENATDASYTTATELLCGGDIGVPSVKKLYFFY